MNILLVIGSVRKNSFNRQLALEAKKILEERKINVSIIECKDIPFMNQDLEANPPEIVKKIKQDVKRADGLWLFSPEYNHSFTGALKNCLDWLSRPLFYGDYSYGTAISGKKVAISGVAGKSGASYSLAALRALLTQIGAETLEAETKVALAGPDFRSETLSLEESDLESLKAQAAAFLEFVDF